MWIPFNGIIIDDELWPDWSIPPGYVTLVPDDNQKDKQKLIQRIIKLSEKENVDLYFRFPTDKDTHESQFLALFTPEQLLDTEMGVLEYEIKVWEVYPSLSRDKFIMIREDARDLL